MIDDKSKQYDIHRARLMRNLLILVAVHIDFNCEHYCNIYCIK